MDARFLKSMCAKGAQACGSRLRPFSLAHRIALAAIDSPFLEASRPITPADLLLALRVCSSREPLAPLPRPSVRDRFRFWRWVLNRQAFTNACAHFLAYLDEHAEGPKIIQGEGPGDSSDIPWPLAIAATLIRNGVPEERAFSMPEGRAVWLYVAFLKMEGAKIPIWTPEHDQAAELLRETLKNEPA